MNALIPVLPAYPDAMPLETRTSVLVLDADQNECASLMRWSRITYGQRDTNPASEWPTEGPPGLPPVPGPCRCAMPSLCGRPFGLFGNE